MNGEDGSTLALQALRAARSSSKVKGSMPCRSRSGESPPGPGRETRSRDWRRLLPTGSTAHPKPQLWPFPLLPVLLLNLQATPHHHPCRPVLLAPVHRAEEAAAPDEPDAWPQPMSPVSSFHISYLKPFTRFVCLQSTNPPSFSTGFLVFAVRADLIFFSTGPVARLHCSLCFRKRGKEQWGTRQAGQRYLGFSKQITQQRAVQQLSDAMVSPRMRSPPASSP